MFFDARAALKEMEARADDGPAPAKEPQCGNRRIAEIATLPAKISEKPEGQNRKIAGIATAQELETGVSDEACPYGRTIGGRMKTWTGKVVSLDEWRKMSDWERHGSTGKQWNAITRQWEVKP